MAGDWSGTYSGTFTYTGGGTITMSGNVGLTINSTGDRNDQISASLPVNATGSVDNLTGNGSWGPPTDGSTPFIFTGTFTSGGSASGTWTLTIMNHGGQDGTGNGTWTATRQ